MTIEQAIEVFVNGFAFTRSFTHPYLAERIGNGIWVMRDTPRTRGDYRKEEYVTYGVDAADVVETVRRNTRGRFAVCAIRAAGESDASIRADYKRLGFRLIATEPFMAHDLSAIEAVPEPLSVVRVEDKQQAQILAKAARKRQILLEHLTAEPPQMRQYMATNGGTPIGWVGSVAACGCTWCSNLFVDPACRRRGVARLALSHAAR